MNNSETDFGNQFEIKNKSPSNYDDGDFDNDSDDGYSESQSKHNPT